ncbi:MAG TPA: cupin domain-containing protein [Clostridia bacterium]|nr:cupin domain-containing protein [Clostridia bacterium]
MYSSEYFITNLNLEKHIEGGYFNEIYRSTHMIDDSVLKNRYEGRRALSTTIYFLLESGQFSRLHELKSDEIWFYHYGSSMLIHLIDQKGKYKSVKLGLNLEKGELPQVLVTADTIFGAEVLEEDSFSLVSCMVSPGFDYKDFRLYTADELINRFPSHKEIIMRING